ncbi:MAG: arsenate reductase family protein [Nitrososphaerales archaeon]
MTARKRAKVYYNPRCTTCRRAIDRLKASKVDFELQDFFKDKLSKNEIRSLLKMAGVSPRDALRKKDKMYKELRLAEEEYSDDEMISLMEKYPGLILRPIIVLGGTKAVIANRPEIADAFSREA